MRPNGTLLPAMVKARLNPRMCDHSPLTQVSQRGLAAPDSLDEPVERALPWALTWDLPVRP